MIIDEQVWGHDVQTWLYDDGRRNRGFHAHEQVGPDFMTIVSDFHGKYHCIDHYQINIKVLTSVISGQQAEQVRGHLQEPEGGDLEKEPVG